MKWFALLLILLVACAAPVEDKTEMEDKTEKEVEEIETETQETEELDAEAEKEQAEVEELEQATVEVEQTMAEGTIVELDTTMGIMKIKLFVEEAPKTTDNFKKLVSDGFYDGTVFHRVIKGFMIQGGDPEGTGRGGPGYTIDDEFGPGLKHDKKGILSMANAGPDTGGSQFFITLGPTPHLNGKHAIFGEVIEGIDVLDKIGSTQTGAQDRPTTEIKITKAKII